MCKIFEYRVMLQKKERRGGHSPKFQMMQLIGMKILISQATFKDSFNSFYPLFNKEGSIIGTQI